jgi:orotidine-5'-phosphate decarboxylase
MTRTAFTSSVKRAAENSGSIVCVGYDPAPVEFPVQDISGYDPNLPDPMNEYDNESIREHIYTYFNDFLTEAINSNSNISAFKFNLGYFVMYDELDEHVGSEALRKILKEIDDLEDVVVILDVKEADIARSSVAYAASKLKIEGVDAITVSPYMGTDSVEPFFQLAHQRGQGVYVLTRTTNPGAEDLQNLNVTEDNSGDNKLYIETAKKVVNWASKYPGTVGSVVAGNNLDELKRVTNIYTENSVEIPLLIPGVGTQGGKADQVINVLRSVDYDPRLARINSSSGIMYRSQKDNIETKEPAKASVKEVARLNSQIGEII